jgi:hypothetical protein
MAVSITIVKVIAYRKATFTDRLSAKAAFHIDRLYPKL